MRTPGEFAAGSIAGALNIPLDNLRDRIGEIPVDRQVTVFGKVGLRGYLACRILSAKGIPDCVNLSGGYGSPGTNIVACQMSMELMGIRREELIDGIEVGGVASYLEASEQADNNLFI